MNPAEYAILRRVENKHWWCRALRKRLVNLVDKIPTGSRIERALDIGCGTGTWGSVLKSKGFEVYGIDLSPIAVRFSQKKGLSGLCRCSANDIGFADNSFGLITCINIFESEHIDLPRVISECCRLLKPNGYCLVLSPAFPCLFSEHDRAAHGVRRFTRKQMRGYFNSQNFHVVLANYFFTFLFPAMAVYKLCHPPQYNSPRSTARSNLFIPPFPINALLYAICVAECRLPMKMHWPFGTSVYVLAQRRS